MKRICKTIEETIDAGLCTGCGTCVGVCPNSAIRMMKIRSVYIPVLNKKECSGCGICFRVCPGYSVDLEKLNSTIFGKKQEESLLGNYVECYLGHSTDLNIRYNSTSGGLVSELLIFALNEGLIDGALVIKMSDSNPLEPEVFIAKTKDEIIEAARSKYCPVPANIALKSILKMNGRFAVVGVSCHIEGIRKAELINKELAKKIVLHLGLICNHAPTFLATRYLLDRMNVKKEDVKRIDYRGGGWPGRFSVSLKNGERKSANLFNPHYWGHVFPSYFFTSRCLLCNDKSCELSDISFGDAHGQTDISFGDAHGQSSSQIGESVIISRNRVGEELLQKAAENNKIKLKRTNSKDVIKSHGIDLAKRRHMARVSVFRKLGKNAPTFNQKALESKPSDYTDALMCYLRMFISSHPQLWKLMDIYPFLMTRIADPQKLGNTP
jgi:coenzyme F420 hydrogenase subunit beta